ncbi:MAG: galactokinase, partial [Chloroflexota bacterium]|nr:galactokinase [Chloroflexota bacterium]
MKVTKVEPIFVDRYLFVQVHTDEGILGLGESGTWGYLEASAAAVEKFGRYLVGKNPLLIEHHWQYMYRSSHFRGAAIMGALSAIDIALWDIAGKHFGVPVHQLLGGKTREKARVYYHVFGQTREELVQGVKDAKKRGFTAVGHLSPFLDEPKSRPFFKTHVDKMRGAIDAVRQYREAV